MVEGSRLSHWSVKVRVRKYRELTQYISYVRYMLQLKRKIYEILKEDFAVIQNQYSRLQKFWYIVVLHSSQ